MKISAVIATYNRRPFLSELLDALALQDFPATDFEVVVVVDGSTDDTGSFLSRLKTRFHLTVVNQENRGLAAARNAGMKAARGTVVLFLDDDLIPAPQLLSAHAAAHRDGDDILAFGPVLVANDAHGGPSRLARTYYNDHVYGSLLHGQEPRWPLHARVGPNSSASRSMLLRMGGFDESFVNAHEDIDLGVRLWCAGIQFRFLPDATAQHSYNKSVRQLLKDTQRSGAPEVRLCRKHPCYRKHSLFAQIQAAHPRATGLQERLLRGRTRRQLFGNLLRVLRTASPMDHVKLLSMDAGYRAVAAAIDAAGGWERFRAEFFVHLPVLLYHAIGPARRGMYPGLSVPLEQFEMHLKWLRENGYTTIRVADWLSWVQTGKPLPARPVLLTFDDAYADLAKSALPMLREHGFTATVFVPTAYIGAFNEWDYKVGRPRIPLMTADDISEWAAAGIDFGAHSRTHPALDTISEAAVADEVSRSGSELRQLVSDVSAFAYPFGSYNDQVRRRVSEEFCAAFTTEEGLNHLGSDPHALRRTMVLPTDSPEGFAFRVRFGFSTVGEAKRQGRKWVGLARES